MDSEAKQKLFEMHGTVQRLEQKSDDILRTQAKLESDIENLDNDIEEVQQQAQKNTRKIYSIYILGSFVATAAAIVTQIAPNLFK